MPLSKRDWFFAYIVVFLLGFFLGVMFTYQCMVVPVESVIESSVVRSYKAGRISKEEAVAEIGRRLDSPPTKWSVVIWTYKEDAGDFNVFFTDGSSVTYHVFD